MTTAEPAASRSLAQALVARDRAAGCAGTAPSHVGEVRRRAHQHRRHGRERDEHVGGRHERALAARLPAARSGSSAARARAAGPHSAPSTIPTVKSSGLVRRRERR